MRMMIRMITCLTLCLLISCKVSMTQQRQLKNLNAMSSMSHSVEKSLEKKTVFSQGDWPKLQWWQAFDSLELNHLISEALAQNPSIQEIQSRVLMAKQEATVTGSLLFPLVFFDAKENRQYLSKNGLYRAFNSKLPLNANLLNLALSFNYEFDFWGKNHNLFSAAIGKEMTTQAQAAEVELIITTAIAQAFFAYKTNLLRKDLYEQLVAVRQNLVQLQRLLLHKGLASNLQVFAASEQWLDAKKMLSSINAELSFNKHLINILAGHGADSPLTLNKSLSNLPHRLAIPKTLSIDLIARRPDLMAQIWRAKALAYKTGAAMAEFYPNINLIGLMGLESVSWKNLLNISSGTAALVPALHLPIFTAGAIRANIKATQAEFDAAIYAYNNLLLQASAEVLDTLVFAQDVYQQKTEQTELVHYAEQRNNLVYLRQQKGLDSQFEVDSLKEELIQKKLVNVTLLYNQYVAAIKLTKALGGGYYQNEIPLVNHS